MFIVSLSLGLSLIANAVSPDGPKVPGALVFSGSHSQVKEPSIRLIRTAAEWGKTWAEHRGKSDESNYTESWQDLEVDFDAQCVVAIFVGDWHSCTVKPQLRGGVVVIRYTANGVQTEGRGFTPVTQEEKWAEAKGEARRPYAFVILSRSAKPIVVEEGWHQDLRSPYVWLPRVTFAAPHPKK